MCRFVLALSALLVVACWNNSASGAEAPREAPAPAAAAAAPASASPAPAAADSAAQTVPPPEPRIDTLDELKRTLAEIPPAFAPSPDGGDPFRACDALRAKARGAHAAAQRLLGSAVDSVQKAELEDILKTIALRREPIGIAYLRALLGGVPSALQDLSREKIEMLKVNVAIGIEEAERFTAAYPQSKDISEARFYLMRLLFLNVDVAAKDWADAFERTHGAKPTIQERDAFRDAFFERIFGLLEMLEKDAALPETFKERTLKIKADAFSSVGQPAKAADLYAAHIAAWPGSDDVKSGLSYMAAIQHYLYAELPEKAQALGRRGMAACDNTKFFPHIADFHFKALVATGKLEDAEALWLKYMPIFTQRGNDPARGEFERNGYRTYAEWALFRLGYVTFALLRYEQAKDYFRQHLEFVKDYGKPLPPPLQVHAQRSQYLFDVLQARIMNPAPELALAKHWAGDRAFSLAENQGKVIAIIFRTYNSPRAEPALLYLQQQYEKYGQDAGPFAVVSVAFPRGADNIPEQLAALKKEMDTLNLTFPSGFDSTPDRALFKQYDVNVGSATLVFVDPLGRLAYYEQDPRPNAFGLFTRVIEALLKG